MKVPVSTALRAELSRARATISNDPVALFVVCLGDEGDLPAWELAAALLPERFRAEDVHPPGTVVVGAAPLQKLVRTLQRAGERELSAALRKSNAAGVPVVTLHDVIRKVQALRDVEAEEAELMLAERPKGSA